MVHAEPPENRIVYAFRPTNEKQFATFLVDRNDYHFFNRDIVENEEKQLNLFSHPDANHAIHATTSFWLIVYHEESF